jgi:DNA-binding MarR family transcriptional regulator
MQSLDVDELTDALLTASRVLVGVSARSLSGISDQVTLAQYRTLVVLASRGPQSLQDLATELEVVPSTASRMCDRLVRKGLIARDAGTADRREVDLSITEDGSRIVADVTRRRRLVLRRIVSDMHPAKRRSLVAALDEFSRAAGEVPGERWYLGWP